MSILLNCFRKMSQHWNKNELKGYKVTNVDRTRKFGVACRSLHELKRKACAKFNIPTEEQGSVTICLADGSQIDEEYFFTIEPQTVVILQRKGETLLSDADILYNTLRQVNLEFVTTGDRISRFLSENLKSKVAVLHRALNKDNSRTSLSSRDEHPEWFRHLDTTANTKEAYMHRRCQDRIRCYLYKTIDQIKSSEVYSSNGIARRHLTNVIAYFKLQLREDHCLGFYFDRSYAKSVDNEKAPEIRSIIRSESEYKSSQTSGKTDESDGLLFNCHRDRHPCKIRFGSPPCGGGDRSCSQPFSESASENQPDTRIAPDEPDARRIPQSKYAKNIKVENEDNPGDGCVREGAFPYDIKCLEIAARSALCDSNGEFNCDGVWNADRCTYGQRHRINPYRSYEELVLFSTWNFDHKIERSRTLIPNLLKVSERDEMSQRDVRYFYDNIFTVKNLRLVHIICHDKGAHNQ